jgi:protein-S-isoprenylcysteine O-methyltransferase Ste14
MNPVLAKAVILASSVAIIVIPAVLHRGPIKRVEKNRKGAVERTLLAITSLGFFLAFVWVATPVLRFADHPLLPVPFFAGIGFFGVGLWLLYRSHADLGKNWSITLEVRETQELVSHGIYRRVRHPMYLALLMYAIGQALVLPNWLAGPAYLVAIVLLVALRVGPEERMMRDEFGQEYEDYIARTKRLIPYVL